MSVDHAVDFFATRPSATSQGQTVPIWPRNGLFRTGARRVAYPEKKPVVLVVEDESLVRWTAMNIVEQAGFEAIGASDADEAICVLESRTDVRAVFTDVQMPGLIDGLRLAQVVKDRWPPVALIVTSGLGNIRRRSADRGAVRREALSACRSRSCLKAAYRIISRIGTLAANRRKRHERDRAFLEL